MLSHKIADVLIGIPNIFQPRYNFECSQSRFILGTPEKALSVMSVGGLEWTESGSIEGRTQGNVA